MLSTMLWIQVWCFYGKKKSLHNIVSNSFSWVTDFIATPLTSYFIFFFSYTIFHSQVEPLGHIPCILSAVKMLVCNSQFNRDTINSLSGFTCLQQPPSSSHRYSLAPAYISSILSWYIFTTMGRLSFMVGPAGTKEQTTKLNVILFECCGSDGVKRQEIQSRLSKLGWNVGTYVIAGRVW